MLARVGVDVDVDVDVHALLLLPWINTVLSCQNRARAHFSQDLGRVWCSAIDAPA